ncbi:hypothetical protein ACEWY4_016891 [Coilia grayii]|uniref:Centrosomal protein of 97 kDa n=1 Tax=Coilia grayii TaxID=363190 RepID=A0ABD1JLN4_9TELE
MMGVSKLKELRWLNLPNNSIGYIEGLKELVQLEWLNLAGNNLKVMDELNNCVGLQYLDLSDNNISVIGDITKLSNLKVLHLHGNTITSLRSVPAYLPSTLTILTLADNEIRDLNEVSYLASLRNLEHLSIMGNPCVMTTSTLPGCDYRPYVVSWCPNVKVLDGYAVSKKEELKAEWMYSQGKGHSFHPGQHEQLMQYLTSLAVNSALQSADNAKLERFLHKQRQHQMQPVHAGWSSPGGPISAHAGQQTYELPERGSANQTTHRHKGDQIVQENLWLTGNDPSVNPVFCPSLSSSLNKDSDSLKLEDVQTDEEKLHGTQLSSESFFLPVASSTCSPLHSGDHSTDTDSYQFYVPVQPGKNSKASGDGQRGNTYSPIIPSPTLSHAHSNLSLMSGEKQAEVQGNLCSQVSNTKNVTVNGDQCWLGNGRSAIAERVGVPQCPLEAAVVRVQAWWRGHRTRLNHPQAKEVRTEIRLRRMQEHIVYLTAELQRVHEQQQQERLQRLVQEEAVKCLWSQLQSLITWQNTVTEQLNVSTVSSSSAPVTGSENHSINEAVFSLLKPELHSYGDDQNSTSSRATTDSSTAMFLTEAGGLESSKGSV